MDSRQRKEVKIEILLGMIGLFQMGRTERLVAPLGFTATQFVVMENLCRSKYPQNTVAQLARHTSISQPSITRAVKRLVDKGYLTVVPDSEDRRKTLISPSSRGRKQYLKAVESITVNRPAGSPYDDWSEQELDAIGRRLEDVYEWLNTHRG